MTEVVESRGIVPAETVLGDHYAPARVRTAADHLQLRVEMDRLGPIRLDRVTLDADVDLRCDALSLVHIGVVRAGSAQCLDRAGPPARRGDVVVAPLGRGFDVTLTGHEADYAVFAVDALEAADREAGGDGWVRFASAQPRSPAAAARWVQTLALVRRVAQAEQPGPLVVASAARLLAAVTLASFDAGSGSAGRDEPAAAVRSATVRRAVDHLVAHAADDLTIADVARAAGVTPRAVQVAFRRHLDTTPMAYLREVRLQRVRADLVAADPAVLTVTAVAARWGFADGSRFGARYRERFGERPSDTLRRTR